jgi:hypothetical protein
MSHDDILAREKAVVKMRDEEFKWRGRRLRGGLEWRLGRPCG